jgi:Leucine-rich repeat (LRR) protein
MELKGVKEVAKSRSIAVFFLATVLITEISCGNVQKGDKKDGQDSAVPYNKIMLDSNENVTDFNDIKTALKYKKQVRAIHLDSINEKDIGKLSEFSNLNSLNLTVGSNLEQFADLCSSLKNLESLTELHITSVGLKRLPNSFFLIKRIKILFIFCDSLIELNERIGQLKKLETFCFSGLNLKKIPKSFSSLDNLQECSLNCVQITSFPLPLLALKKMKYLDLSGTSITTLPNQIKCLNTLQSINICHTPMAMFELAYKTVYGDYKTLIKFTKLRNKLNLCGQDSHELKLFSGLVDSLEKEKNKRGDIR